MVKAVHKDVLLCYTEDGNCGIGGVSGPNAGGLLTNGTGGEEGHAEIVGGIDTLFQSNSKACKLWSHVIIKLYFKLGWFGRCFCGSECACNG